MKKIAIVSWSLNAGGAERAVANLSKDLSPFYDVYIILFDSNDIVYPYCGTILDVGLLPAKTLVGKIFNLIRRWIKIKRWRKKYAFDTVISFMPQMNIYNYLTTCNEKLIFSIRNKMSDKGMTWLNRQLLIWCGKKCDVTVSLSNGVKRDLVENFEYNPDKIVTIYNSCELNWIMKKNEYVENLIRNFDFNHPTVVNVGRLTYQKGQWHLLRALSLVKKNIPDCQLVVFGQGELECDLKKYAKKLGVEKNVFFMGFVKEQHAFLKKCDAFVFSSIFEGLGNALLEALACEIPVISSNCLYGPAEILGGREKSAEIQYASYGVLVPSFSMSKFDMDDTSFEESDLLYARAIENVIKNKEMNTEYRKKAGLRIKDFSPDKIAKEWCRLIG